MSFLGIDIGTTTISTVVYQQGQGIVAAKTVKNDAFLPSQPWEKIQDSNMILQTAMACVHEMLAAHPDIQAIGVTGQMHGIVYLDAHGEPVSPLYIWQDGRGDLPYSDTATWAVHLSEITGYEVATGYGLVTHYYNLHHGLVPENAAVFCTIHDCLAMKLAGLSRPMIEPTDSASLGLYDAALVSVLWVCRFMPPLVTIRPAFWVPPADVLMCFLLTWAPAARSLSTALIA